MIKVRFMTESDIPVVLDLIAEYNPESLSSVEVHFRSYFSEQMPTGCGILVAELNGCILGFVSFRPALQHQQLYWAEWLYMDKGDYRQEVGLTLLQHLKHELRKIGARQCFVNMVKPWEQPKDIPFSITLLPQDIMPKPKLVTLEMMAEKADELREQGKRVVLCHGTFDLLHIGHYYHFLQAKQHGDHLFVTVTADKFVNKGPDRPVFTHHLRTVFIAGLEIVDYVAVNNASSACNVIQSVRPHVFFKGPDYKHRDERTNPNIFLEEQVARSVGTEVIFSEEFTDSSTRLLNLVMQRA
ncbi:hypothetical protein GT50_02815 [Geobacillus stearothermophilus 10]|nr:hypothetical protein GT50_02815 [Geobacillus stearothermophilus 10]